MSNIEKIDVFGSNLMNSVRDRSIKRVDDILLGDVKAKSLIELHQSLKSFDSHQIDSIRTVIIETIDNVIFNTLSMLEENRNNLKLQILDQGIDTNLVDISDGLPGELFSDDGWIARFSKYK